MRSALGIGLSIWFLAMASCSKDGDKDESDKSDEADKSDKSDKAGSAAEAPSGSASDAVKAVQELTDKACACKDMNCVNGVLKEMSEVAAKFPNAEKDMSPEDTKKVTDLGAKIAECAKRIAVSGAMDMAGTKPSGAVGTVADVIKEQEKLVEAACKCKDVTCIQGVTVDMTENAKKLAALAGSLKAADATRVGELGTKFGKCVAAAYPAPK